MNDNVIMAVFNHNTEITTKASTQWNRGQILKIEGIYNLPAAFEVEVSNDRERGAKRYLGHDYEFVIPDEYFESGKMIYIWIMKHVEPTDITSKYLVKIPLRTRQKPFDYDVDPEKRDIVAEAIVALQDAEQEITTKMDEVIDREKKVERIEESFNNLTALAETLPADSEATVDKEKVDTDEENYMIFRFGIPQGVQGERGEKGETGDQGETGNGISNIILNPDYTLTINYTNGTSFTTTSIRGATGATGIKGDKGDAFTYSDFTPEQLASLKGEKGEKGDDGDKGDTGDKGDKGDKGDTGNDGHSPVVTASKTGVITSISIDGQVIATINDGEKGDKGDTGEQGAQGVKGDDGHTPIITASKTGKTTTIYADGTSIATIIDGTDGNDGHSPTVTATKSGTTTTISVDGTSIATINDGLKGDKGDDYILTDQDKTDIANLVNIDSKAEAITVLIGDNISGSLYKINRTYAEIAIALSEGDNVVLFDNQAIYPYVGMINLDGTDVIAFGISATYNGTAILDGYLILPSNNAFKVSQSIKIPVNMSDLTDDVGYVKNITASKSDNVTTIYLDGTAIATINDGAKGDKGDKGDDYTLTTQDKEDIAQRVIAILPSAQGVSF